MKKLTGLFIVSLRTGLLSSIVSLLLTGCLNTVWSGANLAYDRHTEYKKVSDFQLSASVGRALYYHDMTFKCQDCSIDIAAFNGDVLLAGHVPTAALRIEAGERVKKLGNSRRIFNELSISSKSDSVVQDTWITAKIRSELVADARINPKQFKVVTSSHVVYLMGDVIPAQAEMVIYYARHCIGVKRVVKLFKYYNLSDKPA